jgi:WD40 repeat protein
MKSWLPSVVWLTSVTLCSLFVATAQAVEIGGAVREANGGLAEITVSGDVVPAVGDAAEIYFKIPGGDDEVPVAKGKVTAVAGPSVSVKIEEASGNVAKDQLVRFNSEQPQNTQPVPKSDAPITAPSNGATVAGANAPPAGALRELYRIREGFNCAAFSPDGRRIVSGGTGYGDRNGQWVAIPPAVVVWDVATGKEIRRMVGHRQGISSVAFSPDGQRIVSGSRDKSMRIWNAQTGAAIRNLPTPDGYYDGLAAWSPDGKQILACASGSTRLHLWDAVTGEQVREFVGLSGPSFHAILFSPDGRRAVTPGLSDIRIWDMSGREVRRIIHKDGRVAMATCAAISPDGRLLVTGEGMRPGTARLWDVDPEKDIRFEPGTERVEEVRGFVGNADVVSAVAFSPNGQRILTGGGDQTVRLWDVATGKELLKIDAQVGRGGVSSVRFSPDGRTILAAGNGGVAVWALPGQ